MNGQHGYSGKPLFQKLGLKDGQEVLFISLPATLDDLAMAVAFARVEKVQHWQESDFSISYDVIHGFVTRRRVLADALPGLRAALRPAGMLWISWPKQSAKTATDLSENVVREEALPLGLVDVKVCAVDAVWSGLKLVIRKERRGKG